MTFDYLSPEQADGQGADHRSDMYSLGATLFHLIAGRPVFGPGWLDGDGLWEGELTLSTKLVMLISSVHAYDRPSGIG